MFIPQTTVFDEKPCIYRDNLINLIMNQFSTMKSIKSFSSLIVLALMLNSCIVLSLYPFYTADLIHFEEKWIGHWTDSEESYWNVMRYSDFDKKKSSPLNKTDQSYILQYSERAYRRDTTLYLVVPFKINNQLLLDFTPYQNTFKGTDYATTLYNNHQIDVHSLAKLDIDNEDKVSITWLGNDHIDSLITSNKLKIKHEYLGSFLTKTLLTASSEELVSFIEKYMNSKDGDQWGFPEEKLVFKLKRK